MPSHATITSPTIHPSIACGPPSAVMSNGMVMNGPIPIMLIMLSAVAWSKPKRRGSEAGVTTGDPTTGFTPVRASSKRLIRTAACGRMSRMNRRQFLRHTIRGGAATTVGLSLWPSLSGNVQWQIGCFNRPWTTWSFDETLRQIRAAGYQTTGLLTRTKDEPFIGADATPDYLARLKQRIAGTGLKANMGALRSRHDIPLGESIAQVRTQIEHAGM